MNMPVADINHREIGFASNAKIMPYINSSAQSKANISESDLSSIDVLDQHFSLQHGSHKDVKQYVIYYNHLMAYFADGTHCGLAKTNQFVAFAGHRDTPTSIILNKDSIHIEIETAAGLRIKQAANPEIGACVQMRIPTQEMFTSRTGDDYFIA